MVRVQPVKNMIVNNTNKTLSIKPNKNIDSYYVKELKEIKASKLDSDLFVKVDEATPMEKVKNRIQILLNGVRENKK